MRVRAQDANGDMTFGQGSADFLVNSPAAVAQLILTGLKLLQGEWFLDQTVGMPWATQVLGTGTLGTYDMAIRAQILGTPGVEEIVSYSSSVVNRALPVAATVSTIYGAATFATEMTL